MKKIEYYSASELLERARAQMVPLTNQWPAQKKIASLIARHLNKLQAMDRGARAEELFSGSAFLLGPTGNGKTFIIKSLAEVCGLHFATIDCASITMAGYKGKNLGEALAAILKGNPGFFEGGILNVDEADKMFYKGNSHYDAYSPMQDLLKLMEGGDYTFVSDRITETVNLDRTLILLSGACAGITEVLKKRYNRSPVSGFLAGNVPQEDVEDYGPLVTLDDLVEYGMMPELASRVNTVIHIPKIDTAGYKRLLVDAAKTSALNRFRNQFRMRGVQLEISRSAANRIAEMCAERNVGARSIAAILGEQLTVAYDTVDDNAAYNKVVLTADGEGALKTRFSKGERLPLPDFIRVSYEGEDFSILEETHSENSINHFCDDICQYASLRRASDEALLYNFLQTGCRYLARNAKPNERRFENLLKLAEATDRPCHGDDAKSPFDAICEGYLDVLGQNIEKADAEVRKPEEALPANVRNNWSWILTKNRQRRYLFNHYYSAFSCAAQRQSDVPGVLTEALKSAKDFYIHFMKEPKEATR